MALYAIGDLHLSFGVNKPMEIFGPNWDRHIERLQENWQATEEDTTVLIGDTSWASDFEELRPDFTFLEQLKGKKILLKGNHDYWWTTMRKMETFVSEFPSISFLHNNSYEYGSYSICGTRGWIQEPGKETDLKVLAREVGRLRRSLETAKGTPIVFLHYPPVFDRVRCADMMALLKEFRVTSCYYGHLHGYSRAFAKEGNVEEIQMKLLSADHIAFEPMKIL